MSNKVYAVVDYQAETKQFVEQGLWGGKRSFEDGAMAIGFATEGAGLVAGVVYHDYDPEKGSVEMSAYSSTRRWLNRRLLSTIFAYPFEQIGCRITIARMSEQNAQSTGVWERLGAEMVRLPEVWGEGIACIVAVLTKDNWQESRFNIKG